MIGYVTLGTNDVERARAFYDALLAEIGAKRLMEFPRGSAWGTAMDKPALGLLTPFDGKAATRGNGTMAAPAVDSKQTVNRLHARAPALCGQDEGAPDPRTDGFYAACFRDLDGNKLNAFFMG